MRKAAFDFFERHLPYGSAPFAALAALLKSAALILGFIMLLAGVLTWMERRQSAMMQDRIGPTRANIGRWRVFGLLHFVADALKMIFKEDFVPPQANKLLFALAPMLAVGPILMATAIIPFGPPLCYGQITDAVPLGTCIKPVEMQ